MTVSQTSLCQLCEKNVFKYKCPKCYVKYCSLQCFKTHQESPCEKVQVVEPVAPPTYQFPTRDTVSREQLRELGNNLIGFYNPC